MATIQTETTETCSFYIFCIDLDLDYVKKVFFVHTNFF